MSAPSRSPPSPFSPAPSARPPSASTRPAPVRVPAPGISPNTLPLSNVSTPFGSPARPAAHPSGYPEPERRLGLAETERLFMPPIPAAPPVPPEAAPPMEAAPKPRRMDPTVRTRPIEERGSPVRTILVFGGVAVVLIFVAGFVVRQVRARRTATLAARAAEPAPVAAPPAASLVATAFPGAAVLDASAVGPGGVADAAVSPVVEVRPFDKDVARAALEAATPKLAECKLPKGKPIKVKVTFTPQGAITGATPLPPYAAQKTCVATHLKEVKIAPFQGAANSTAVYALTVPKP